MTGLVQQLRKRNFVIKTKNPHLKSPLIITSISSARDERQSFENQFDILTSVIPSESLVSAYDLSRKKIEIINTVSDQMILVLDSGGFELRNSQISKDWNIESYKKVINKTNFDILVSFDHPRLTFDEQLIQNNKLLEDLQKTKKENYLFDFVFSGITAPSRFDKSGERGQYGLLKRLGSNITNKLSYFIQYREFLRRMIDQITQAMMTCKIDIIGIPEACMGDDLQTRTKTLSVIVKFIDENYPNTPIHIFGVGNPEHIIQYYRLGADIFDGTSWSRKLLSVTYDSYDKPLFKIETNLSKYREIAWNCDCQPCQIWIDPSSHVEDNTEVELHNIVMYKKLREFLRAESRQCNR